MGKKNLMVNCANCDMRGIQKELLDQYEKIMINASCVFTSPKVQVLTAPYDVEINCANVLVMEEGTEVIQHNGVYRIKAGDKAADKKYYLMVNGKLMIEPGTEELLKQCVGIAVNGKLVCPASMLSNLPQNMVNGKTECYPDGAVVVDSVFYPDSVFALRAKKQAYYASNKVVMADASLDVDELVQKGVCFVTPKALINEKLLKQAVLLFEEETDIKVLKDGMSYLNDDITLGKKHLKKQGTRIYVDGDVRIEEKEVLEQLEELIVNGTVRIKEELEEAFSQKENVIEYQDIIVERGTWICDKISFTVEPKLFAKGAVHVSDVAKVTIAPQVTEQQILELLELCDCAKVCCTKEQRSAVEMVSTDVAKIDSGEADEAEEGLFGALAATKMVNIANYTF